MYMYVVRVCYVHGLAGWLWLLCAATTTTAALIGCCDCLAARHSWMWAQWGWSDMEMLLLTLIYARDREWWLYYTSWQQLEQNETAVVKDFIYNFIMQIYLEYILLFYARWLAMEIRKDMLPYCVERWTTATIWTLFYWMMLRNADNK